MQRKWRYLACICAVAMLCATFWAWRNPSGQELQECPSSPEAGKWYRVTPEGALASDGSQWYGQLRLGTENKVMIYMLGGGVSLDAHTAARSDATAGSDGFYYQRDGGISTQRVQSGIGSMHADNPFRNWTVILIPYSSADFHAGSGEAPYTALNGKPATIYHNGYDNCMRMLESVRPLTEQPEALLITGYSAGGFGAAMLADDIIETHFPDVQNITLCVDGALLVNPNWHDVASQRWHAPEKILSRTTTDNLTLDHLAALHDKYGEEIKLLFTCSTRDGGLARYQSYIDTNIYTASEAYGDIMLENLRKMVQDLSAQAPGAGIFLWNDIPHGETGSLTRHTILSSNALFEPRGSDISIARWMLDAVEGRVASYGLNLLDE